MSAIIGTMKTLIKTTLLVATLLASRNGFATERIVTLKIDKMYCSVCSLLLEKKLAELPGVMEAIVSYEDKTAKVVFDDGETALDQITATVLDLGYTSQLIE